MSNTNNNVKFTPNTVEPGNRYSQSTTTPNPGLNQYGIINPGTKGNRTPSGSYNPQTGRYTGDFRGLGVVNPWGGKRSRRMRGTRRKRFSKKRKHSMRRRKY